MKELIKKLVESYSPSGYEAPIRQIIRAEIESLSDEIFVDNLGNLVARRGSRMPGGKKIMLAAHIDEIGVIASYIDENGFVRFLPIGGVHPRTCVGGRVRFLNGASGVIYAEKLEDVNKVPSFDQLFIDLGTSNIKDTPVRVGDVAAFDRPFQDLGNRLVAKAMDDRIGVAVLIETMRRLASIGSPALHQIYFVFSTQEEVGTRGATTAAFNLDPDIGLAVDVTPSGDTPKGSGMVVGLGKGPAIKVRDQGNLSDPRVIDWMVKACEKATIPYQLEVLDRGGTDARAIQLTRSGVPAGCLSIPCRYVHSPSEMVDFQDVQNAVQLLVDLLSQPVELGDY